MLSDFTVLKDALVDADSLKELETLADFSALNNALVEAD